MRRRFLSGILALTALSLMAQSAFAADIATEIRSFSIPVTISVTQTARQIHVTMPASMPVSVKDGSVFTADNLRIENHSDSTRVRVVSIEVHSGAYEVVPYTRFPAGKGNRIALEINGCETKGPGTLALDNSAFPVLDAGDSQPIRYRAKVSTSGNTDHVAAANVIFTLKAV